MPGSRSAPSAALAGISVSSTGRFASPTLSGRHDFQHAEEGRDENAGRVLGGHTSIVYFGHGGVCQGVDGGDEPATGEVGAEGPFVLAAGDEPLDAGEDGVVA